MKISYNHLSYPERRKIERWRHARMSATEIARRLGRHRSTVFRELRRNHYHDAEIRELTGYYGLLAHERAQRRRFRRRKMVIHAELRHRVEACLKSGWSPEQIAGRLKTEPDVPHRPCHEPICQFVYSAFGRRRTGTAGELRPRSPRLISSVQDIEGKLRQETDAASGLARPAVDPSRRPPEER